MLRRGDHHGIDRFIVQQVSVIRVSCRRGECALGGSEAHAEDIAEGGDFRVRAGAHMVDQFHAAVARTDETDPNPVVCIENPAGNRGQRTSVVRTQLYRGSYGGSP